MQPIPKLGGLSVAAVALPIISIALKLNREITAVLISSSLILVLGIYDDIRGADWKEKLLGSACAISILIFYGHLRIASLGNIFGLGKIDLGPLSLPFTYFAMFGIINAINLIDGLNGLLCGVSIIAFCSFACLGYFAGNYNVVFISMIFLGAIAGFMPHNYPKAKIFLGDTGSLLLGFMFGALSLMLIRDSGIKPVIPPFVLLLPVFDAIRVLIIRVQNGQNPFQADKKHFHHLVKRSGISDRGTVLYMWSITAFFSISAVLFRKADSDLLFIIELLIILFIGFIITRLKSVRTASSTKKKEPAYSRPVIQRMALSGIRIIKSAFLYRL